MNLATATAGARNLFGVPIAAVTLDEALDLIHDTVTRRSQLHIGVVNAAKVVNMHRDELLRNDVLSSDVIFADGAAVVWASRLLGRPLPERVAGIDLMMGMLARGNRHRYRVYCLGAAKDVLQRTVAKIAADFPGVQVVGCQDGYFTSLEEQNVAEAIAAAKPDILFVAMTSPKKEHFMARWSDTMRVPVVHGVGGSFDVVAGKVQRAPLLWQKLGLEWLYRVKQEPRRLWRRYLVTNTLFCWMLLGEMFQPSPVVRGLER